MSSIDDYIKCPNCGNEQAMETDWVHTGEYSKMCPACGWRSFHTLDYNAKGCIYDNVMPIDKSVLDINLPDYPDDEFYNNENNQLVSEVKAILNSPKCNRTSGQVNNLTWYPTRVRLFCGMSVLINPIREYIATVIDSKPDIKAYAEEYSRLVPLILYDDVEWFIDNLGVSEAGNPVEKSARFLQFIYELYVVEIKLFDKCICDDNLMTSPRFPLNLKFEWGSFIRNDITLLYAHRFIDIANIIKDIKKSQGYNTFAFWYMNDYFERFRFCEYVNPALGYDLYEELNTAANNVDYASGRYDVIDSTEPSFYIRDTIRTYMLKQRNVVCYIHADSKEEADDITAIVNKYVADNKIKYYKTIVNLNPINDHYCDELVSFLSDINRGLLSRIIVVDKEHFVDEGFDVIDYLCYLNNIELIVLNDLNRKSAKDIMTEMFAKNEAKYIVLTGDLTKSVSPDNSSNTSPVFESIPKTPFNAGSGNPFASCPKKPFIDGNDDQLASLLNILNIDKNE